MGLTRDLIGSAVIDAGGGKKFTVRGITPDMIGTMLTHGRGELDELFQRLVVSGDDGPRLSLDQGDLIVATLMREAPQIAALIIATAAADGGEDVDDEQVAVARAFPASVQLAALEAIAGLTFTSDMPPKKVMEIAVRAMGALTGAIVDLKALPNGSGESGGS